MRHIPKSILLCFVLSIFSGCGSNETQAPDATVTPAVEVSTETTNPTDVPPMETPLPTEEPLSTEKQFTVSSYPTLYADIPDLDIIRVGEAYYMVSTTMNLCPGVPIMKSTDLTHWEIVNYVYETFTDDDIANLENGKDMYSHGSWAASLKYNESDGLYYVAFSSNDHGFFIYTTDDIENGTWTKHFCRTKYHDPALFFDNGNLYVISASGGRCQIQQLSLDSDEGSITQVGSAKQLFTSSGWSLWEGAHAYKVGEYYYVMIIASPADRWMRTEVCYRSKDLFSTDWEEKIVYQGGCGGQAAGLAQGGIVETQFGDWYAFLFQDRGGVGRVPSIVSVCWEDDWPLMGAYNVDGSFTQSQSGMVSKIYLPKSEAGNYFTASDNFSYEPDEDLKKVWQWNHNPKNDFWSVTEQEGFLRLTTDTPVNNIWYAHNSLTQRTYGKTCVSEIRLLTDNLKPGDYAGLASIADHCGMIGVLCDEQGDRYIFQANADFKAAFEAPNAIVPEKLAANQAVYLKISYSFSENTAQFFYSLDGETWTSLGNTQSLGFSTNTTFMGTRSWLFCYATNEAGGFADFDYYLVYDSDKDRQKEYDAIITE